jgi:hypothetical protein
MDTQNFRWIEIKFKNRDVVFVREEWNEYFRNGKAHYAEICFARMKNAQREGIPAALLSS